MTLAVVAPATRMSDAGSSAGSEDHRGDPIVNIHDRHQPPDRRAVIGSTAPDIDLDEMADPPAAVLGLFIFVAQEQTMNQQSGKTSIRRESSFKGNLAVVVTAVALAFGMSGVARAADVHGNIVAAERYRAPQASTQDVELGDQSIVQRLQHDARFDANRKNGSQADDMTADRMKANPRNNPQADDATAERMKANPRRNPQADDVAAERLANFYLKPKSHPQADDTTAERMKANPRNNPQADDTTADRMKANPRNNRQADDTTAERMKANPKN